MLTQTCNHPCVVIALEKTEGLSSLLMELGIQWSWSSAHAAFSLAGETIQPMERSRIAGQYAAARKQGRAPRSHLSKNLLAQTHHFKQLFIICLNKECRQTWSGGTHS